MKTRILLSIAAALTFSGCSKESRAAFWRNHEVTGSISYFNGERTISASGTIRPWSSGKGVVATK